MAIPAPGADEDATPIYGIRKPKSTQLAKYIWRAIARVPDDVESALQTFGLPPVVSTPTIVALTDGARDAHFGTPATAAARRSLQDGGATTIRPDKGWSERYFAGLTDGGANPGGALVAGWYPTSGDIISKVAIAADYAFAAAGVDYQVPWASAPQLFPGMWAIGQPTRLVLPIANALWEVWAMGTSLGTDNKGVSSVIALNGAAQEESRQNLRGVTGVIDPFLRGGAIVATTAATDYVEWRVSVTANDAAVERLVAASTKMWARYLGPKRS